jgi:hypothetical protein
MLSEGPVLPQLLRVCGVLYPAAVGWHSGMKMCASVFPGEEVARHGFSVCVEKLRSVRRS